MNKHRLKFKPSPSAHSSYLLIDFDGEVITYSKESACYSYITYHSSLRAKEFYIFFGKKTVKAYKDAEEWANWVINSKMLGEAFITKDAKEGLEFGFEINTKAERALMQGAIMALRRPFEFPSWSWGDFRRLGYGEYESFALATNLTVEEGFLLPENRNVNHLLILRNQPLKLYKGKGYKPCLKAGNLYEGFKGTLPSLSVGCWGCKDNYSIVLNSLKLSKSIQKGSFGIILTGYKFNKANINKVLKYLRGL